MINGTHIIIDSKDPESDSAFFRDVLKFPAVDSGHGWLIFALPPAEAAFYGSKNNGPHEVYFMCDDLKATIKALKGKKVKCGRVQGGPWGNLATISLPGGGTICLYQPRHPTAIGR